MPPLGNRIPSFATPKNFLAICYCCFIFVAKKRCPKILVEINLGLFYIRENFNLFQHTLYIVDCDNIEYEISSQVLTT